jgi:UBX domain-containing protein 1
MSDQDTLISEFCGLTSADTDDARHFLEASKWDLNLAINQYFSRGNEDEDEEDEDDEMEDEPSPVARGSSSSKKPAASSSSAPKAKRLVTISDLRKDNNSDHSDSDEEGTQKDFFAGGEKSALAIQNPKDAGKQIIDNILSKAEGEAQSRRQEPPVAGPSRPRFSGGGQTLGSEDSPSITVPDPSSRRPGVPESVTKTLTFWRDGFSIEDGPLMRYDDPANQEILRAIQSGIAPTHLMGIQQGQRTNVHVYKRMDEDYVAPKKKVVPFGGHGNRLGSPTPATEHSTPAAPPVTTAAASSSSQAAPTPSVTIDSAQPSSSLQIRLGDGSRLVSRFNHTHTVGDVYSFVNSSSLPSRSRNYVLQTTFPNKELTDHSQTVKEAGLVNAVVVQKWL